MATFSKITVKFAIDLLHVLSKENPCENIMFSPANLTAALGLLFWASESDTAAQIEKILHWDEFTEYKGQGWKIHLGSKKSYDRSGDKDVKHRPDPGAVPCRGPTASEPACPYYEAPNYKCDEPGGIHTSFHKILTALNRLDTDYQVDIANRLYADFNIAFIEKLLYCALEFFLTEVDGVDFKNKPEEVWKLINLWVEIQTHGKIKDFLPKESIDCKTRLVLVNALSFKGQWELQFDKAFTQEGVFYLNERDSTTVQYMYQMGQYNIGTIEEYEMIEIPYRNKVMSLFILLPQDASVKALQKLEDELTAEKLLDYCCILKPQQVEVLIPKFSMEKSIDITSYLDLSNMTDPKKADLSPTTTTKNVALTQLAHDTFFEVDEEGGEKAKGCHCDKKKHVWDTSNFVVDHPFLFFVLHKVLQSIVIFGRFSKPE